MIRYRLSFILAVLAFASLACSIGMLTPAEPLFSPPNSDPTETPALLFPTVGPSITPGPVLAGAGAVDPIVEATPTPAQTAVLIAPVLYYAQAGDTLKVVATRFGVDVSEIISPDPLLVEGLIQPNQLLVIPNRLANLTSSQRLIPDSELVYSSTGIDFDIKTFVEQAGGYLGAYREWLGSTQWTSGAEIIQRVALENSINPRLLLALLEYQGNWVYGQPANAVVMDFPLGKVEDKYKKLYKQLDWACNQLSYGYYGWREGKILDIQFSDGVIARLAPDLNAGTVALMVYLSQIYDTQGWVQALDATNGLPALYEKMFGSPWLRALQVEPLFPKDLVQPDLILPFFKGQMWSFTGGPHGAWEREGALAALDFAPNESSGCQVSSAWALAAAPGVITRSEHGVVALDMDGDGYEQTGWVLLYLHIGSGGRVAAGTWVEKGDLIGHPSCEGGVATGSHVHLARKFNGEWILADGPLPFNLGGWVAHKGDAPYKGTLVRDGEVITSSIYGEYYSHIMRQRDDP